MKSVVVREAKTNILRAHAYKREQTMDKTNFTNNNNYKCEYGEKKRKKKHGARSTRITSRNLPLNIPAVADKTYHPWQTENRRRKYGN